MYIKIEDKVIPFEDCLSFWKRFLGLMFQFTPITDGLRFPKCNSIHSFFMFQAIDVIITDKDDQIIALYPGFRSEKIIFPKKNGYYVYELPLDSIQRLKVGDFLKVYNEERD